MAQAHATTLFHFTKTLDVLQSILKNSFWPRYRLEDVTWLGIKAESFAFPMVCFCDIPLGGIQDHVKFYGGYGLGLSREWAIKSGLNPIFYLSRSSALGTSLRTSVRAAIEADKTKTQEDHKTARHLYRLLGHMKPLSGTIVVNNAQVPKEFYLENEWRYVPHEESLPKFLTKESYDDEDKREQHNETLKDKSVLGFSGDDIRYVFVPKDADIPLLVDFMNSNLGHMSVTAMKILTTRITSLEHIARDV